MKLKLIEDCQHWWRMASVQLALLAGALAGLDVQFPQVRQQILAAVPERWRPLASLGVTLIVAGAPILARMAKQPKLQAARDGQ